MSLQLLKKQTSPLETGAASVLIEGRPAVVLSDRSSRQSEIVPAALPKVLIEGQPPVFLTSDSSGAATVLGQNTPGMIAD